MSKKKMRAFACAVAATLAFAPFLGGCMADGTDAQPQFNEEGQREDVGSAVDEDDEAVRFGQVVSVDGDAVTIVMGELRGSSEGERKSFSAGEDEMPLDMTEVRIVDESGSTVEGQTLEADDVVAMWGTSEGTSFKPEMVEILDVAYSGANADEGRVPQAG